MTINQNKVVEFIYELEVEGNIVDHATEERPLDYIQGTNSILPKLEAEFEGKQAGYEFDITLAPVDAYGEVDPNRIIDLPKAAFEVNGEIREDLLVVGTTIPLINQAGQVVPGVVIQVDEASVRMDLNSRMAGKTLHFTGKIVSVREATEKELKEGLHGEFVHHGCSCSGGCHSHEGGCHSHEGGCEGGCGGHEGGCGGHEGGCGGHEGGCGGHEGGCGGHEGGCEGGCGGHCSE